MGTCIHDSVEGYFIVSSAYISQAESGGAKRTCLQCVVMVDVNTIGLGLNILLDCNRIFIKGTIIVIFFQFF